MTTTKKTDDKKALQRIEKELQGIQYNQIDGVKVTPDKINKYLWHIVIKGPKNSPYVGGTFEYTITFSSDYPFEAPYCEIETGIYHPDYYGNTHSEVCLKSLYDGWSPSLSIRSIIIELQTVLAKPIAKNQYEALNSDAFEKFKNNKKQFEQTAKEWTKLYAMKYQWTKEKQTKMLKESKEKKSYITKTFKSVNKFETKEIKEQKKKDEIFTKKILSKKPDGNVAKRELLLHVMHEFAKSNNQKLLFSENNKNKNSRFITGMSDNKNQRATLVLDNLEGLIDTTNNKHTDNQDTNEESKTDNSDEKLKKEICVLKDAIKYNKKNKTIDEIKKKIAKSYNVDVKYVQINDISYGSVHIDYNILTHLPNNGQVTDNLRQQFQSYRDLNLHPLFFDFNFRMEDFDSQGRGNKTFSNGKTFQIGPPGRKKTYTQPTGWTRFGLMVLDGRYNDNNGTDEWLHPFNNAKSWYRAFHGTKWSVRDGNGNQVMVGNEILRGNHPLNNRPAPVPSPTNERYAYLHPGGGQRYRNSTDIRDGQPVGRGVYCTPNPNEAERYAGTATINTTQGAKSYKFMFQVCVDPDQVRIPTDRQEYWVVPENKPEAIRPYGILLKEV